MKVFWLVLIALSFSNPCLAQQTPDLFTPVPGGEGWQGFLDVEFLLQATLDLALAAALGAAIAFHPRHLQTGASPEGVEEAQVYILYSVIGAIIGILVVHYGMAVGFVLFGIGALIRFRTILRSVSQTGRLIFVTLIGLSTGLNLPHVAILVTAFGFLMIFLLEAQFTFRINIRGLSSETFLAAVTAYREALEQEDCHIISEKKYPVRGRVIFIVRCTNAATPKRVEESFKTNIDEALVGSVDWEIR